MFRRIVALAVLPVALTAQAARDSIITVSASRMSRIAASSASFYVTVEGSAETALDAVARVEAKVGAVTDAIRAFGARAAAGPAISYSVGPPAQPGGYPPAPSPHSHLARTLIKVHAAGTDAVARIIASAIAAGATGTSTLSFEAESVDSVRRALTLAAIAAARRDAEAIAASLGGRLGAFVDASSSSPSVYPQASVLAFDTRYSQQPPAPEVTVATNVTVRFRLVR